MHPNVTLSKDDEKKVEKVVLVLNKLQVEKDLHRKGALGRELQKAKPHIRAEAERRFQRGVTRVKARGEQEEERTFLKIKAGAQGTPNKPKDTASADTTRPADPDASAVADFLTTLEDLLHAYAQLPNVEEGMRKAAQVTVDIKPSCRDDTKAAAQGLLDSIAGTVDRVFQEGGTLVIPRSEDEIQAQRNYDDISRRNREVNEKVRSHRTEGGQSKTPFGKAYERSRVEHYERKKEALPKMDDALVRKTEAPGRLRTQQTKDVIATMLGDLRQKAKTIFTVVGGKGRLVLREGIDGGVETMNIMIQGYANKLNKEAESGSRVDEPLLTLEAAEEEEDETSASEPQVRTTADAGPARRQWQPGVKPARAEEEEEESDEATIVPPSAPRTQWQPGVRRQSASTNLTSSQEEEEESDETSASQPEVRTTANAGPTTTTTTTVPPTATRPDRPGIRRQPARTNLAADAGTTTTTATPPNPGSRRRRRRTTRKPNRPIFH